MVWPGKSWNSVVPLHAVLVAPSHLFPTGHEVQLLSTDDVPANEGYSVALQVLKAVHVSALALALNTVVPSHAVHSRSDVAVGGVDTFVPAEQVRAVVHVRGEVAEPADDWYCKLVHVTNGVHVVWPDVSWYSVLPSHAVLVVPLHLFPTGHSVQVRSTDDVPANEGYSLAAQVRKAMHVSALTPVLNAVVPSQLLQVRSVVALGAFVTRLPAAHVRHAVQTRGAVAEPADEANVPLLQVGCALHVAWPGSSWYSLVPLHAVVVAPLRHL